MASENSEKLSENSEKLSENSEKLVADLCNDAEAGKLCCMCHSATRMIVVLLSGGVGFQFPRIVVGDEAAAGSGSEDGSLGQ